jgi:hypothetical protein
MDPRKTTGVLFFYVSETPNVAYHPRSGVTVECNISILNKQGSTFDLLINDVALIKGAEEIPLGIQNSISFKKTTRQGTYAPEYQNKTVADILTAYLSAASKDSDRAKGLNEILGKREVGAAAVKGDVRVDEGGIPEGMKYTTIAQYMRLRPKAYCVARAIQLLSPTLLGAVPRDVQTKSGICLTNGVPGLENSVPHYDSSITQNAPGLRMLHQLFFDVLDKNAPKISAATQEKYNEFLRIMKVVYTPDTDATVPQSLDRIQSKALPGCGDKERKDRELLVTNAQALRNVRQQVAQLLQTQIRHTAEVSAFLKQMFLIDKYGQIVGLSPALQKGGLPAVNVFAERARILLTEYYKKCEGFYRVGALAVLEAPGNQALPPRR